MGRRVHGLLRWCEFKLVGFAIASAVVLSLPLTVNPAAAAGNPKYASIVVDAYDGKVLYSRSADSFRYPASLTKMMTLYMVFDAIEAGEATLKDKIRVSSHAASQPPSKLGLKPGNTITVDQAIRALVTKSANDVASAVAEHFGGSERAFARMMTEKARELGMSRTTFRNASGLPNTNQRTTARDMAKLGRALMFDFPKQYKYFSQQSFTWRGTKYKNHNKLLSRYGGTHGIKTGYTRASGFNLTAAVEKNGYSVVAVVMGGRTSRSRDDHMVQLLDRQFARLKKNPGLARRGPLIAQLPPGPKPKPLSAMLASVDARKNTDTGDLGLAGQANANDPIALAIASLSDSPTPTKATSGTIPTKTASLTLGYEAFFGEGDIDEQESRVLEWLGRDQHWGIQIGAFAAMESAAARLSAAAALAPDELKDATPAILPTDSGASTLYRARFGPFDEVRAQAACSTLSARGIHCVPIQDNEGPDPKDG